MGTRIALVDDDQNILTSVSLTLESEGFEVDCYHDGETALRGLSRRPAELAVLDIKMPRMDGYQATRAIRQLPGEAGSVPVIALTANNLEGDDLRCFVAGMDDYLAKPVHSGQLEDRLRHWVTEAARRRA